MSDRSELLNSMYLDNDDDEDEQANEKPKPTATTAQRSRYIAIGAIRYEVPTVMHVASMEDRIAQQATEITRLNAELRRLRSAVAKLVQATNQHSTNLNSLSGRVDGKVDRRDF